MIEADAFEYPRGARAPRGYFASERARGSPRREQGQCGCNGEADTGGHRIDGEIFETGVPSRYPELKEFEHADHQDGKDRDQRPMFWIGQSECQPDQHESEPMLAILTEIGMRAVLCRSEGSEGDGGGEQPGDEAK